MKQRISTLIDFFVRDKASTSPPAHGDDGPRDGASMRPERLRDRRATRAHRRRGESYRPARAVRCAG
ncbi:hypothetical protein C9I56_01215 [Paraburkholderia caribensis]|jgi:hypothetical protein|uniref:Uncharacterized protein n=1 Tax=Paraburkholderia caribensis TaxID=75105 RepID=A0A9Q6S774_9BURK|nr:hypothetical protein AN416_19365 [Paraburkholderia caribensis]AMV44877.1 hypothetical protein ATN79_23320 [Paraburkholderia caribensis]AUT54054.1 hypothetical protein C2L66_19185 [Paraburkholderia caribensis]MDR6386514.1 hypothetical protein [Paraburkholderia caribensis]PTB30836.1 hypothetical protein C9I56_01215 [Paraburkholderia caribensis]